MFRTFYIRIFIVFFLYIFWGIRHHTLKEGNENSRNWILSVCVFWSPLRSSFWTLQIFPVSSHLVYPEEHSIFSLAVVSHTENSSSVIAYCRFRTSLTKSCLSSVREGKVVFFSDIRSDIKESLWKLDKRGKYHVKLFCILLSHTLWRYICFHRTNQTKLFWWEIY